jgi:hypothetical protein
MKAAEIAAPPTKHFAGGVAAHVDLARLMASEQNAFDIANSRLIDGRAIHHFLQYVEPILEQTFPQAASESEPVFHGGGLLPALDLAALSLALQAEDKALSAVVEMIGEDPKPISLDSAFWSKTREAAAYGAELGAALGVLQDAGLAFFTELAIAEVRAIGHPLSPGIAAPLAAFATPGLDAVTAAEHLLYWSARAYLLLAARAELAIFSGPRTCPFSDSRYLGLAHTFAVFTTAELERRLGRDLSLGRRVARHCTGDDMKSHLEMLGRFVRTPLCQEMVACWTPFWRRSLFIFNSSLDPIPDLRELVGFYNAA